MDDAFETNGGNLTEISFFKTLLEWLFPLESNDSTTEDIGDDWSTILSFIMLIRCRNAIGKILMDDEP